MEHRRGVDEAERHDHVLEVAERGLEGCLPLIPITDMDQVVGVSEIQLGVNTACWSDVKAASKRQGIPVTDSYVIETTVVNAQAQGAVLLLEEKETSSHR